MKRSLLVACAVAAVWPAAAQAQGQMRSQVQSPAQGQHVQGRGTPDHSAYDKLIAVHAKANLVPEALVHRVIVRESRYNPDLVGRGGTIGLMQLKLATARGVGFRGDEDALRDPETNLTYGIKYLAGAWRAAEGDHDRAMHYYAVGYYYVAKQQRLERLKQAAALAATAPKADTKPLESAKEKPAAVKPKTAARRTSEAKAEAKTEVPRPPAAVPGGANSAKPR